MNSNNQDQPPSKAVKKPESPDAACGGGTQPPRNKLRSSDSALFRPVVDDSCRRSFLLPTSFTLDALQKDQGGGTDKSGGDGGKEGGEKSRVMSPISTLLLRTDY